MKKITGLYRPIKLKQFVTERETETETERETERQIDRETERTRRDRQTESERVCLQGVRGEWQEQSYKNSRFRSLFEIVEV